MRRARRPSLAQAATHQLRRAKMPTFQPLINLIVLLTVLSVAAERVANIIKFRDPDLRNRELKEADEREREGRIQSRVVVVGMAIATIVKADPFSILTH